MAKACDCTVTVHMVLVLDGNSEQVAHVWRINDYCTPHKDNICHVVLLLDGNKLVWRILQVWNKYQIWICCRLNKCLQQIKFFYTPHRENIRHMVLLVDGNSEQITDERRIKENSMKLFSNNTEYRFYFTTCAHLFLSHNLIKEPWAGSCAWNLAKLGWNIVISQQYHNLLTLY